MKKVLIVFLLCMGLIAVTACSTETEDKTNNEQKEATKAEVKKIRAGVGITSEHPQYQGLLKFKELVEERTNGEIVVDTFHSGQMGDDRTMMESLQLGSLEVALPSTAPVANFIPEFSVFEFPFLFPSQDVANTVLYGEVGQQFLDMLQTQNMVGLAYWEDGFRNVTNSKREIATLEDLKGLSIRTMENDLHIDAFRALGVNPTPMAFAELFTAMQQKTIDGQENPFATIYYEKFNEVQGYVSNTQHINSRQVFIVSKMFFDDLTEEQQQIVREAAIEAGEYQGKLIREKSQYYLEELQKRGMVYTEISEEERNKMREAVQPVIDKYAKKIGEDLVQEVYDAIEAATQ